MFRPTEPYRRRLGDELVLKSIASEPDIERVAAFNGLIHGEGVAAMTRELILHHPHTRPEEWLFVEDEETRQVVSSLCLIPWTLRYDDVQLKAGEVGIVGTLEAYRHRGLVRAAVERHEELLRDGRYDVGMIQGIPYFYRQFGYEYAIPLEGGWRVELYLVPEVSALTERIRSDPPPCICRQALPGDIPALMQLYDQAAGDLSISAVRDEATWQYLLGPSLRTEMVSETWLVLDASTSPVGYFRIPEHGFGEGLIVNEVSRLSNDAAHTVLRKLKDLAVERSKPYVRLCLPPTSTLVQIARGRGAHDLGTYAWQIHLVDVGRLLLKLAPLLERRIAASPYAGLTQNLCLNLYRQAFELRFQEGQLVAVDALGFSERGGFRLPPLLAAPLLLGYRSREELQRAHHDVSLSGDWQHLADVLFPQVASFICTIY